MPIKREILDAIDVIARLKVGDRVEVTEDERGPYVMYVSQPVSRSDGQFGSIESTGVYVHFGVGRYGTRIQADHVGSGRQSIRPLPAEDVTP
jgi:hypothetical protein